MNLPNSRRRGRLVNKNLCDMVKLGCRYVCPHIVRLKGHCSTQQVHDTLQHVRPV